MSLYIQFGTSVAMERNYNALVYISVYTSFLTAADGGEKSQLVLLKFFLPRSGTVISQVVPLHGGSEE